MDPLKNTRRERFAVLLAEGNSAIAAYRLAGYKPDFGAASRLSANVNIRARVEELQAAAAEIAGVTLDSLRRELDHDRAGAQDANQWSAAISATMAKAKLFGFLREEGGQGSVNIQINLTEADKRLL